MNSDGSEGELVSQVVQSKVAIGPQVVGVALLPNFSRGFRRHYWCGALGGTILLDETTEHAAGRITWVDAECNAVDGGSSQRRSKAARHSFAYGTVGSRSSSGIPVYGEGPNVTLSIVLRTTSNNSLINIVWESIRGTNEPIA